MRQTLHDIVKFRGDRLFNGAVSVDWFFMDDDKRRRASEAFVFHGPKYHGVSQDDIGQAHGHRLQDTATFAQTIVRRCHGLDDQPFTLAIAGYGTGKSHFALTMASLLAEPRGETAEAIIAAVHSADSKIGADIQAMLREEERPCLIIAVNGMQNFDLTAEITRQVLAQLRAAGLDTTQLDDLRPRFKQAATLIGMAGNGVVAELLEILDEKDIETVLGALEEQNEQVYGAVQNFFADRGMPIRAFGGESVRDVLDVVSLEYCGSGKPFRHLLILFDEFGRYTEFATVRSQVAGSGVLQDLFEGVQAHADATTFVGFIQFELNAYVQRVAPEYKNDILRYITRYQSAAKVYLSINLETLIAHLIEKQQAADVEAWFDDDLALGESKSVVHSINNWFPQSRNYRLWSDPESFHNIIRKGCWPLSPLTTWFLFSLTSAGKHLQERSALALLGDFFRRSADIEVAADRKWLLPPTSLWSDELQQELIASEEGGQQGSITHAYASVYARHRNSLGEKLVRILRAVVLAAKLGLQVVNRDHAVDALAEFTGLASNRVNEGINLLQHEYNILEWDERFKQFEILGDAVPRTQFLSFLRQRVAAVYDECGKAQLFAGKAAEWCDLFGDLDCDFAEKNYITTTEWRYQGVASNLETVAVQVKIAADRWIKAIAVNEPRGTVIYCYVEQSRDPKTVAASVKKILRAASRDINVKTNAIPILVILLSDNEGILGQALAELAVIEEGVSAEDRARFGNLIDAHREKMLQVIRSQIETLTKERRYVTALQDDLESKRLGRAGTELFERIYSRPLTFPFDGFSTTHGNAADSCLELITDLLRGSLDYDAVISKPVKVKNRALTILANAWGVFTKAGKISRRPTHPIVRRITEKWDDILQSDSERFIVGEALKQLCRPAIGANIASAGLLLGVFVAPRSEKLIMVRDGQQYALTQWLQEGVFKKKFLDLPALSKMELSFVGEASSEWDNLLDEWEQIESYLGKYSFLRRAFELKERIQVPPTCSERFLRLEEQAHEAAKILKKIEKEQDEAFSKLEAGERKKNVSLLSWGAVELLKIKERMIKEAPLWEEHQANEIDPHLEHSTQMIIHVFPTWLAEQRPVSDTPEVVGDFKHKMLRKIGANLRKLGLNVISKELEQHTINVIRQAETIAKANQLIRDIHSWLDQHGNALRIVRVAELRGLKDIGKTFVKQLNDIDRRTKIGDIPALREELATFLQTLKEAENSLMERASQLWDSEITSKDDLDKYISEINDLVTAFEGCESDLEDLQSMNRALLLYKEYYMQLNAGGLTWQEFDSLVEKLQQEAHNAFDEDDVPWPISETFAALLNCISRQRQVNSLSWLESAEADIKGIDIMPVNDANRLHSKLSNPPAVLTDEHAQRLSMIVSRVEERLESLELDWLIEKFRGLPKGTQKKFLEIVPQIIGE